MADTFTVGGTVATFNVLFDPPPLEERDAKVSSRGVPWGNVTVTSYGGRGPRRWPLTLDFASQSAYDTFSALVGQTGTLVWFRGTFTVMLLPPVKQTALFFGPVYCEATATFQEVT